MPALRISTPARSAGRIATSLALLLLTTACGLKGPLYMPAPPPPDPSLTTPPAAQALPESATPAPRPPAYTK